MTLYELMEREREIGHEEGFAEGIEQGIEQGMEQGIEQGLGIGAMNEKRKMALAMLGEKIPIEIIARCTGMIQAEIEELMM